MLKPVHIDQILSTAHSVYLDRWDTSRSLSVEFYSSSEDSEWPVISRYILSYFAFIFHVHFPLWHIVLSSSSEDKTTGSPSGFAVVFAALPLIQSVSCRAAKLLRLSHRPQFPAIALRHALLIVTAFDSRRRGFLCCCCWSSSDLSLESSASFVWGAPFSESSSSSLYVDSSCASLAIQAFGLLPIGNTQRNPKNQNLRRGPPCTMLP